MTRPILYLTLALSLTFNAWLIGFNAAHMREGTGMRWRKGRWGHPLSHRFFSCSVSASFLEDVVKICDGDLT